ncbi:MAG: glycine betaine ABC transporter substrate-binding protein [Bacteroidota bacterium]
MSTKRLLTISLALIMLASSLFVFGCQADEGVVVGSKEFTEQLILGQIAILALEHHDIPTVDETGLGGTVVVREAQERGDVDLFWEYTGTALITHLGFDEAITDPEECFRVVSETDLERNQLIWLDITPFNNTYTIMMRQSDSNELGIRTISDLAAAINEGVDAPSPGTWNFATDHEYTIRDDGYPGLPELYGFEFEDVVTMDLGITYGALRDGDVVTAMGFATDGRIAAFELVNLVDDLNFHPVYNASPVIRQDTLEEFPQIADILNPISRALDAETMSSLNMQVDIEERLPSEVAEEWLIEQGFIE